MGLLNTIGGIFGYDRKSSDAAVDSAKAYAGQVDLWAVEQYRSINDLIEQSKYVWRAARDVRAAGVVALGMAHQNASMILDEFKEMIRRRGEEQKATQSSTLARAAASGTEIRKGSSSDIYMKEQKSTHSKELAWMDRAGKSQASIAIEQGRIAMIEAEASAKQVEAQAMGMGAAAREGRAQIKLTQAGAQQQIDIARANRSAARTGMYGNIAQLGLSFGTQNYAAIIAGIKGMVGGPSTSSGGGQINATALTKKPQANKVAAAMQFGTNVNGFTYTANPLTKKI